MPRAPRRAQYGHRLSSQLPLGDPPDFGSEPSAPAAPGPGSGVEMLSKRPTAMCSIGQERRSGPGQEGRRRVPAGRPRTPGARGRAPGRTGRAATVHPRSSRIRTACSPAPRRGTPRPRRSTPRLPHPSRARPPDRSRGRPCRRGDSDEGRERGAEGGTGLVHRLDPAEQGRARASDVARGGPGRAGRVVGAEGPEELGGRPRRRRVAEQPRARVQAERGPGGSRWRRGRGRPARSPRRSGSPPPGGRSPAARRRSPPPRAARPARPASRPGQRAGLGGGQDRGGQVLTPVDLRRLRDRQLIPERPDSSKAASRTGAR